MDKPLRSNLQWSHDLSAMDTAGDGARGVGDGNAFNGAMTFQPWIHGAGR